MFSKMILDTGCRILDGRKDSSLNTSSSSHKNFECRIRNFESRSSLKKLGHILHFDILRFLVLQFKINDFQS
jgi:hypothetical protein